MSRPIEEMVAYEYETERVQFARFHPKIDHDLVKEGGPVPGLDRVRLLPDKIVVRGRGAYYPSVGEKDGRPDWGAYFRAVDGKEPMVYVWREDDEA